MVDITTKSKQYAEFILNSEDFNLDNCILALEQTQRNIPTLLSNQSGDTVNNPELSKIVLHRFQNLTAVILSNLPTNQSVMFKLLNVDIFFERIFKIRNMKEIEDWSLGDVFIKSLLEIITKKNPNNPLSINFNRDKNKIFPHLKGIFELVRKGCINERENNLLLFKIQDEKSSIEQFATSVCVIL